MNENLYLIYVNNLGVNFIGANVLEFIFSESENRRDINGEDWDAIPASSRPQPPEEDYINGIGVLETEIDFEFAQDSTCFCYWDAMDGIIALTYEDISQCTEYPDNRIIFHFGETLKSVEAKLYERDLKLKFKK